MQKSFSISCRLCTGSMPALVYFAVRLFACTAASPLPDGHRPAERDCERVNNQQRRKWYGVRDEFPIARGYVRNRWRIDSGCALMSAHKSPTRSILAAIVRNVNVRGATSPRSISSQVHGAETGAPGFARTA